MSQRERLSAWSASLWSSTSTLTLSMPNPEETRTPAHVFCPGRGVRSELALLSQGVLQRPSSIRPSMTSTSPDSDVYNPNETNNAVQRMSRTSKTEYFILEWTFCLISMWLELMYLKSLHVTILVCNDWWYVHMQRRHSMSPQESFSMDHWMLNVTIQSCNGFVHLYIWLWAK